MTAPTGQLAGKVAIITGATKGMGAAMADLFAAEGARVVLSARTAADVEAKAAELNARYGGGEIIAIGRACEIERKDDLQAVVDLALSTWGKVTTLVCNACGMPWIGPTAAMPDDQVDFQFLTVFKSKFWLVNMVLPSMIAEGDGAIVFISSGSAFESTAERNVYSCMRLAELHFARNIAAEYGPQGIRINSISPGLIETHSSAPIFANDEAREFMAASVPLHRTGKASEIASAALFLASDAGSFTTGHVLPVDGGRLIKAKEKMLTKVYGEDNNRASEMPQPRNGQ